MPARKLDRVIGVIKAYSTRVGGGPFPTELDDGPDGIGERIRKTGREYGTVTGRPRRCGWFDAVAVRYTAALARRRRAGRHAARRARAAWTELKICTAYELDGERHDAFPERRVPAGEVQAGLRDAAGLDDGRDRRRAKLADLPADARRYVDRLGELVGLPVSIVSVGPDREQTIMG